MSSHKYNVETGRYGSKHGNIINRICGHCTSDDKETIGFLQECPFFDPIVEDEFHILTQCPLYMSARQKLRPETKQLMQSTHGLTEIFNDKQLIRDIAKFALRCHNTRFPEEKEQKGAQR